MINCFNYRFVIITNQLIVSKYNIFYLINVGDVL